MVQNNNKPRSPATKGKSAGESSFIAQKNLLNEENKKLGITDEILIQFHQTCQIHLSGRWGFGKQPTSKMYNDSVRVRYNKFLIAILTRFNMEKDRVEKSHELVNSIYDTRFTWYADFFRFFNKHVEWADFVPTEAGILLEVNVEKVAGWIFKFYPGYWKALFLFKKRRKRRRKRTKEIDKNLAPFERDLVYLGVIPAPEDWPEDRLLKNIDSVEDDNEEEKG